MHGPYETADRVETRQIISRVTLHIDSYPSNIWDDGAKTLRDTKLYAQEYVVVNPLPASLPYALVRVT